MEGWEEVNSYINIQLQITKKKKNFQSNYDTTDCVPFRLFFSLLVCHAYTWHDASTGGRAVGAVSHTSMYIVYMWMYAGWVITLTWMPRFCEFCGQRFTPARVLWDPFNRWNLFSSFLSSSSARLPQLKMYGPPSLAGIVVSLPIIHKHAHQRRIPSILRSRSTSSAFFLLVFSLVGQHKIWNCRRVPMACRDAPFVWMLKIGILVKSKTCPILTYFVWQKGVTINVSIHIWTVFGVLSSQWNGMVCRCEPVWMATDCTIG